uniref:Uncharacterized protein n=1 Tax=Anopheles culicifacies TaxID=139723 RepID=A0A182LZW6_9DIPT
MQLVNRGHRSSSTVSADGHQLPATAPPDIALMRWSSRGFTAIPVEPDEPASSDSSSTVDSLVPTARNGSTPASVPTSAPTIGVRKIEYLTLDTATGQCGSGTVPTDGNLWQRMTPQLAHQNKGQRRTKQHRHGNVTSSSASASIQPSIASSTSCLRDCLLCRCCRSGQYALSFGDDQTSNFDQLARALIGSVTSAVFWVTIRLTTVSFSLFHHAILAGLRRSEHGRAEGSQRSGGRQL